MTISSISVLFTILISASESRSDLSEGSEGDSDSFFGCAKNDFCSSDIFLGDGAESLRTSPSCNVRIRVHFVKSPEWTTAITVYKVFIWFQILLYKFSSILAKG